MAIERVAVTGGNGKIGEATLREFADHGYETVDLARGGRREDVSDQYLTTDLLDLGEVYGSLAASDADAVVHMGTIPHPESHPEHVTFESNAMTTYHVLEAATALDLEAVALASSINVMGASYQDAPTEVAYLPIDEAHPLTPRDPYALGKHAAEVDRTLPAIRDQPYAGRSVAFSYLHLKDAAAVARRAVEADFEGHEPFWTVAADTSAAVPSERLADECFPDAQRREPLEGHDALISVEKAERVLDWTPERSWREF